MAKYTNSKLATYKNLSNKHSGLRTHPISKIAIHHMAGVMTGKGCADYFATTSRDVSSNYFIGYNGDIAQGVEEKFRAWTTSSNWCDQRAITIEVSNSASGGNWPVSDNALSSLINLVEDIARRNNIKEITYTGGKDGVLQKHEWYANTVCPGPYLGSKFSYIASEVNKRLKNKQNNQKPSIAKTSNELYRVRKSWSDSSSQIGAFKILDNAKKTADKNVGYNVYDSSGSLVYGPALQKSGAKKTISQLAKEVLNGAWGNGGERKARLTAAGYDYSAVQNEVNRLLKKQKDSNYEERVKKAAQDVWAGKYGNNPKRAAKLKSEGLNPDDVQSMVNKLYY